MILKNMFLSEAAILNPDNTFSVLKGGANIFNLTVPQDVPVSNLPIRMALLSTLELEVTEMGRLHNAEVILMDADGRRIIPEIRNHFQPAISSQKGYHNLLIDLVVSFPRAGVYCFYINVDGHELGALPFTVVFHSQQPSQAVE